MQCFRTLHETIAASRSEFTSIAIEPRQPKNTKKAIRALEICIVLVSPPHKLSKLEKCKTLYPGAVLLNYYILDLPNDKLTKYHNF